MASTRNKNTPLNYAQEQRRAASTHQYLMYEHSSHGTACDPRLPGNGLLPAQMPWTTLSHNAADTESFLFGIGSTNLVEPKPAPFVPEIAPLDSAHMFDSPVVWVPEPLRLAPNQRPMYLS